MSAVGADRREELECLDEGRPLQRDLAGHLGHRTSESETPLSAAERAVDAALVGAFDASERVDEVHVS
jgi:hypothetical protein